LDIFFSAGEGAGDSTKLMDLFFMKVILDN